MRENSPTKVLSNHLHLKDEKQHQPIGVHRVVFTPSYLVTTRNYSESIFTLERTASMVLSQRQLEYQRAIEEYERNLEDALRKTQMAQAELAELQEEKVSLDHKSNETIHALKEEYEKQYDALQQQLNKLQEKGLHTSSNCVLYY